MEEKTKKEAKEKTGLIKLTLEKLKEIKENTEE